MTEPVEPSLTVAETARLLGLSERTVSKRIRDKEFVPIDPIWTLDERQRRIPLSQIEALFTEEYQQRRERERVAQRERRRRERGRPAPQGEDG